jgi:hypothetical protein
MTCGGEYCIPEELSANLTRLIQFGRRWELYQILTDQYQYVVAQTHLDEVLGYLYECGIGVEVFSFPVLGLMTARPQGITLKRQFFGGVRIPTEIGLLTKFCRSFELSIHSIKGHVQIVLIVFVDVAVASLKSMSSWKRKKRQWCLSWLEAPEGTASSHADVCSCCCCS